MMDIALNISSTPVVKKRITTNNVSLFCPISDYANNKNLMITGIN